MGIKSKVMGMSKEYVKSPERQFFKYLLKILEMSKSQKIDKKKVKKFFDEWYKNE